jgi:hypothetical protein
VSTARDAVWRGFACQRQVLDAIAEFVAHGQEPSIMRVSYRAGLSTGQGRKCLRLLEAAGFVKVTRLSAQRVRIEIVRDPDDAELKAATDAAGRAS